LAIHLGSANGEYLDFSSLSDGSWNHLAEIGYQPKINGLGEGSYRAGIQHANTSDGNKASTTWSLSMDQELTEEYAVFCRFGSGDGRQKSVKRFASTGIVWLKAFGFDDDWLGVGGFWAEPTNATGSPQTVGVHTRKEFGLESYYRMQLTKRTQMTVDAMLIRPSVRVDRDLEGIFSVRFAFGF
jgi:hypothetical protein